MVLQACTSLSLSLSLSLYIYIYKDVQISMELANPILRRQRRDAHVTICEYLNCGIQRWPNGGITSSNNVMSKFAFETRTCLSECLILFTLSCAMSEYLYRGVQRLPNSEMTCIRRYDKHVRVSNEHLLITCSLLYALLFVLGC